MKITDVKTWVVGNPPPGIGGKYFIFVKLMTEVLGYERFISAGGDHGAIITQALARKYPDPPARRRRFAPAGPPAS